MYGFPKETEKTGSAPLRAIAAKINVQYTLLDNDIEKLEQTNVISTKTIPTLSEGEKVKAIFVFQIDVKRQNYNRDVVAKIANAIAAKAIFIIRYDNKAHVQLNYEGSPIRSEWESDLQFVLQGHALDLVWENLVKIVGQINTEHNYTLLQQIKVNELKARLDKEIATQERKARAERQPARQRLLFQQLQTLKANYQNKINELVSTF